MTTPPPSIFNDVIGPVMRGPSSSHCAAAVRIGRMARDLMDGEITEALIQFDPSGSLATTHASQGSDMGLFGGFLGWEPTHPDLADSASALQAAGTMVKIEISPIPANHPNTYKMTLHNQRETHQMTAISTGGGIIEVTSIDGLPVSMAGDYFETMVYFSVGGEGLLEYISSNIPAEWVELHCKAESGFVEIKSQTFLEHGNLQDLRSRYRIDSIKEIGPVLPILSRRDIKVPFLTCSEMLEYNRGKDLALWELAARYEVARGGIPEAEAFSKMEQIIGIMRTSIDTGLAGTQYADRILGYQSGQFQSELNRKRLLDAGLLNRIILYTSAIMESKSAMKVIVAAPTAGSCGGLPGACFGAADEMGLGPKELVHAMFAGSLIGVFIAAHATFAAEVGGCQAECGSGSGMAAAALVNLAGGSTLQAVNAASMALQNVLGMVCDPVANRVEVPCLGKNVMAASNALACANMALAGYDPIIPLDEVIQAMDSVGKMLPSALRCTALGGLSVTKVSKEIERKLAMQ